MKHQDRARKYIRENLSADYVLSHYLEREEYIIFTYGHRRLVLDGDHSFLEFGPGPVIININDDRVFEFGSIDGDFEELESKYGKMIRAETRVRKFAPEFDIQGAYNLLIHSVSDIDTLAKTLHRLNFRRKSGEFYFLRHLREMLANTPITFEGISGTTICDFHTLTSKARPCEWTLSPASTPD